MKVIGLTGGIASGKSTVAKWMLQDGILVLDADQIVRELQQPGTPLLKEIEAQFGNRVITKDGQLDRPALGALIFGDEALRRQLDRLIHPRVKERLIQGVADAKIQGKSLVVLDVPLLFETGFDALVDEVVVVYAPQDIQLKRLMGRDGIDQHFAIKKIGSQGSLEEKKERARYVLDNGGSLDDLKKQYEELINEITA